MTNAGSLKWAAAVAALILLGGMLGAMLLSRPPPDASAQQRFRKDTLEIETGSGSRKLDVELAVSHEEQAYGLMYRTSLADEHGMLFMHPKAADIRMWMRNTYIPLDMVFIRADGTIHRIAPNAEPLSETVIESNGLVTAVLELAGGAAARLGLKAGDQVRHAHFKTEKGVK